MDIEIKALNKLYRGNVQALNNLDLTIPNGMYGLLGPNGAGKTTLMRILAGILRPTSGSLSIGSHNATTEKGRTAVKRILGYLPQDLGVYPDLTAYEFLDYIGILKGLDNRQARQRRVNELLELVALSDVAKRRLKTFSGGMKRRVGIAQALLNDPELLIVDEPTAGLDPEERIRFRNMLADLGGNRIVLLSTHIVEDIAQTCQKLAIMQRGHVIFQGTVTDLVTATTGKVWTITTQGSKPTGDLTVVSTMNMGATVQYRVVGEPASLEHAVPTQPGLEDGYIWLMRDPARAFARDGSANLAV
ncbi:MAG TPA: ABC transporter ATP-binding protein [Ktedonobacteraceae bacterium]|nr:ABC transporter ATP-binding protein [Ktedonobacteraceae bacterium]